MKIKVVDDGMKADAETTKQIFELVQEDLMLGLIFGTVAEKFGHAMLEGKLPLDSWLYKAIFVANLREMIMALARLIDNDKGTASIPRFLEHANQNPQNFESVVSVESVVQFSEEEFRQRIAGIKQKLIQFQQQADKVKTDRDKILAHTDRRYRTETTFMCFGEDTLREMKSFLEELHLLVNSISTLLNDAEHSILATEQGIDKDFAQLLEDREPHNKRP